MCSALKTRSVKNAAGEVTTEKIYMNTTDDNQVFWSQELIGGGQACMVQERKKGEKYTDRDGNEKEVQKDGLNFVGVIGGLEAVQSIKAVKAALAEMD